MWQDSGRYEWPLTGPYPLSTASAPLVQVIPVQTPDQVVTIAAPTDIWCTLDGTALVTNPYPNWYTPNPPGPAVSSAGIVLDTRTYPEQAAAEIADLLRQVETVDAVWKHTVELLKSDNADLRRQVEAMKAENCDLLLGHAELTRRLNEMRARVAELEQAAERHAGTL